MLLRTDGELEQLQSESEALVGKLEAAIGVLRREKEEADVELSNTKAALEEHDDTIYDLKNTLKRRQREHDKRAEDSTYARTHHTHAHPAAYQAAAGQQTQGGAAEEDTPGGFRREEVRRLRQLQAACPAYFAPRGTKRRQLEWLHRKRAIVGDEPECAGMQPS